MHEYCSVATVGLKDDITLSELVSPWSPHPWYSLQCDQMYFGCAIAVLYPQFLMHAVDGLHSQFTSRKQIMNKHQILISVEVITGSSYNCI